MLYIFESENDRGSADSVQPMRAAVHEIFRRKDSDYEERK